MHLLFVIIVIIETTVHILVFLHSEMHLGQMKPEYFLFFLLKTLGSIE